MNRRHFISQIFTGFRPLFLVASLGLLGTSCTLLEETELPSGAPRTAGEQGVVNLNLSLSRNTHALAKAASADTTFDLDSLIIVFTANGHTPLTYTYPVTGRADLGDIHVEPKTFVLPSLRVWKAKFYSIDITPERRDTVHLDSVSFNVRAAETTFVAHAVRPAYSILRVRFLSTNVDSLPNSVKFLRLRVDGIVRDSIMVGAKNASLNWLQAMSGTTIHAAGDSGRVLRSTNDGLTWEEQTLTTQPLVGGHFYNANKGSVVTAGGKVFTTENGGTSWQQRDPISVAIVVGGGPRPGDSLNAAYYNSDLGLFAVGNGGGIYKSGNAGWGWHAMVSNTPYTLNGIHFPTPTTAFVVGENETILRTTNANASVGALPQDDGVVWEPVAGGWFHQTSITTNELTKIQFTSPTVGWALGKGGVSRYTVDAGATWEERGGLEGANINSFHFNASNKGYAVGDNGALRQFESDWWWAARTSGTSQHLYDVRIAGADTMYIVGANATILRSTNSSTTAWPYLTLTTQTAPAIWPSSTSAGNATIRGMHFPHADTGWAVTATGTAWRTVNGSTSWTETSAKPANGTVLNGVWALNGSVAVAVGNGGVVRRTVDGGASWTTIASGVAANINAVVFLNGQVGWFAGVNVIRNTNDSGKTWSSRDQTGTFHGMAVSSSNVWAVGASGKVMRTANTNPNSTFSAAGNTGLTGAQLNAAYFVSGDVGWVVGSGGLIAKTTNGSTGNASNVTWTVQTSNTTKNLTSVWFANASIGYAAGEDGTVVKTTNGGTTWTVQTISGGGDLHAVQARSASLLYVAGENGKVYKSTIGGGNAAYALRSVWPVTSRIVYAAGDDGVILKSTNAGIDWALQGSNVTTALHDIQFRNANNGYAVGDNGTLLQTTNGGADWIVRSSGTTQSLRSVTIVNADTAYVGGTNGVILKTVNGGATWYEQETPVSLRLNTVHAYSRDLVFAVGQNGTILKAVNEGDNWTGGGVKKSLKGVHFPSTTVGYIVGESGTILKTTNGGNFWFKLQSGASGTLYGVYFTSANEGWVTGDGGQILKTTNGGASWSTQSSGQDITLRWTHFRNNQRGFVIGGTQTLLSTTNGGANWGGSFVGMPGARTFDEVLTYKYFQPNKSHTVLIEAIDRLELPLRGYQATKTVIVGAGVDSVLVSPLSRCGYGSPIPNCIP